MTPLILESCGDLSCTRLALRDRTLYAGVRRLRRIVRRVPRRARREPRTHTRSLFAHPVPVYAWLGAPGSGRSRGCTLNRPISVYRPGEMPIQSCGQCVSAPRGKAGARLNAHTELRAKRQRSAREAINRNRAIGEQRYSVRWRTGGSRGWQPRLPLAHELDPLVLIAGPCNLPVGQARGVAFQVRHGPGPGGYCVLRYTYAPMLLHAPRRGANCTLIVLYGRGVSCRFTMAYGSLNRATIEGVFIQASRGLA